jgi:hypothetical protein
MGPIVIATLAYAVVHVVAYFAVLRRRPEFRRERTVFLYHTGSFVALTSALAIALPATGDARALAAATTIVALHAIYSLSFLELWSLSEGGYSLSILRYAAARPHPVSREELLALSAIGVDKREARLGHLVALGLVERAAGTCRLTWRGRVVAAMLRTIRWLANVKRIG